MTGEILGPKPVGESFDFEGKTYTLRPTIFSGANVDKLNDAIQRSRRRGAVDALTHFGAMLKGEADQDTKDALAMAQATTLKEMRSGFAYPSLPEIVHALKYDPVVVADCIFRMSPECQSLAEAQKVVREHPEFSLLSLKVTIASGVRELGKSAEFQATQARLNEDSSGSSPPSDEPSSDD